MEIVEPKYEHNTAFHFKRSRLSQLFIEAIKSPLVLVCAGAGYGKTSAVHDFIQDCNKAITVWVQLSERDNVGRRFWENYTHTMKQVNPVFAGEIGKIGFPDTPEKLNLFHKSSYDHAAEGDWRIVVFDDFHFIKCPEITRFVENAIINMPPQTSVFLISRSTPDINTAGLVSRGQIFNISEDDLRFTDHELSQYFHHLAITVQPGNLREIMQDTEGWAFAINLIARSFQKSPAYSGYLRTAMKTNIFRLMETEIWDSISERLQIFLVRLSLIDHLSVELIALLAEPDQDLVSDLEQQNAYVSRDSYINAYLIHPLFLEFLVGKQDMLSEEQKRITYTIAGEWCKKNGFKIDALSYFEKIGGYTSIISSFYEWPSQIPYDLAKFAASIFDHIPMRLFTTVDYLAILHIRLYVCQGLWQKATELTKYYESQFLELPESEFKNQNLGYLYYHWSSIRVMMCLFDHRYDFDTYIEKFCILFPKSINDPRSFDFFPAPWMINVGSPQKGTLERYIESLARSTEHVAHHFKGFRNGHLELARGELHFYQGDLVKAAPLFELGLEQAKKNQLFDLAHRALFYIMRVSVAQGNYLKAEQVLKDMRAYLDKSEHAHRYANNDILLCWYFCVLGLPDMVPDRLKGNFLSYGYAGFLENLENQMKARYSYAAMSYSFLLAYIQEMRQRESFLYGFLEMLAMEACIHYKMKNKEKAFAVLTEAYESASPNGILMPFIELGKDMRILASSMLKETTVIPRPWLNNINRKAASYAKHQAHIINEYKQKNCMGNDLAITSREREIITDLAHGLTRTEIAASRNLSINAVKIMVNSIYSKLGAKNLPDLIRRSVERKLI